MTANTIDAGRLTLLLNELRLPATKALLSMAVQISPKVAQ